MKKLFTVLMMILGLGLSARIAAPQTVQDVRVRWDASALAAGRLVESGAPQPSGALTLLERRRVAGSLPRQRVPQLSSEQLLVVAVDRQGREVYRYAVPDPRILRTEFPGPTGELTGEVRYHATTALNILLPDDPGIVEIRLYHPRWTGTAFSLEPVGSISLR